MQGKVVLITGAASGMGRATALAFARRGATVAVVDIDEAGGRETVDQIAGLGGDAEFFRCDVASADDVAGAVGSVVERFGGLDYAHNNAGVEGSVAPLVDQTEADWDRVHSINLKGVFLCMRAEIPFMLQRGGGAIVNTASASGLVARPGGLSTYVAAKHGVVGLTKCAAVDYSAAGIRVNAVCPGPVATPFLEDLPPEVKQMLLDLTPIRRFAAADEIAEAVVWLCSDDASYVTGAALPVDGGVVAF